MKVAIISIANIHNGGDDLIWLTTDHLIKKINPTAETKLIQLMPGKGELIHRGGIGHIGRLEEACRL